MSANRFYPRRLDHMRYARNGFVPESTLQWRLLEAQNHIVAYRRKTFWSHSDYTNGSFSATGTVNSFRFRCHTGYAATHITFVLGIGLDDKANATDPYVEVDVTVSGGATTSYQVHHGTNNTGPHSDAPDDIAERIIRAPVSPNTTYEILIKEVDWARLLDGMAYEEGSSEIDTTVDFYVDQSQGGTGAPIYDQTTLDSLEGLSNIWRKNGAHLLTWAGDTDRANPTFASTSWANIIDGGTGAFGAASPSFYIAGANTQPPLSALCRLSDADLGTVNVVLAVHCSVTNSATGEVRLIDDSGTLCSITGMGTAAGWYTSTTTIADDGTVGRVAVQCRTSNAANTVTLNSVCLYTYLA